jgi:hypothetical protein
VFPAPVWTLSEGYGDDVGLIGTKLELGEGWDVELAMSVEELSGGDVGCCDSEVLSVVVDVEDVMDAVSVVLWAEVAEVVAVWVPLLSDTCFLLSPDIWTSPE